MVVIICSFVIQTEPEVEGNNTRRRDTRQTTSGPTTITLILSSPLTSSHEPGEIVLLEPGVDAQNSHSGSSFNPALLALLVIPFLIIIALVFFLYPFILH